MNFSTDCVPRIKEERKRLRLGQSDVADAVGISREMWGKYERGIATPSSEVLMCYAGIGADVQYILTGVRSSVALAPDEKLLIEAYRTLDAQGRLGALGAVTGLKQGASDAKIKIRGKVGHAQTIEGNVTYDQPVTINMGSVKRGRGNKD